MAETGRVAGPSAPRGVAIRTLGCKVNQVESEELETALALRGVVPASEDRAAVVVVNTCSVTGEADRKARKVIRHALGQAAHPMVVVTGCLAAHDPVGLASLGRRVVVEPDKDALADRVAQILGSPAAGEVVAAAATGAAPGLAGDVAPPRRRRTRAMLKIQDGCDALCAYCIVPHLRGAPRSRPLDAILERASTLAATGTAEVVLTGINLGRYEDPGHGHGPGGHTARLPDLLRAVSAAGIPRVRLSSVEPPDVDEALLAALAETRGACPHLHVPLQSGSDRVLSAMGRRYSAGEYLRMVAAARAAVPGIALSTDVMVGLPGETDEDFEATMSVVEQAGFIRLHVFRYSARPGTRAADMPAQVRAPVKARRSERLREQGERLARAYAASREGRSAEVLVESVGEGGLAEGTSEDYLKVRIADAPLRPGDLVDVTLALDAAGVLVGTPGGARLTP